MIEKNYAFDKVRLEKREELLKLNVNPYPYDYRNSVKILDVIEKAEMDETTGDKNNFSVKISGRIWAKRDMGKTVFMDLKDNTAKIQLYLNEKMMVNGGWDLLPFIDMSDIIGVSGDAFKTRKGELSIRVNKMVFLSKAVVSIPFGKETDDKVYYRATDPEIKYRERYIHWLLDHDDRERIMRRFQITSLIREWMNSKGFLEVSTPTVEFVYGGAEARPFETSIWALGNKEAFLRISPELYLKRYIVSGFDKVYTICQNFRNEGIDNSHNPEFSMMEWYEAFTDYNDQMQQFEEMVSFLCEKIHGTKKIIYQEEELDFTPPWKRISVLEALKEFGKIDASDMTVDELKIEMKNRDIEFNEPISWGVAIVELFETICEEHLIQPTFIIDHPVDISPLTKLKRGDVRLVERFEPYIFNMEVGNGYSELTDPVVQLERLQNQRDEDEYENHPIDADFVKAIGCGMLPTGGVGLGIDRIIMLLTDSKSIRDIIPFPLVKPK